MTSFIDFCLTFSGFEEDSRMTEPLTVFKQLNACVAEDAVKVPHLDEELTAYDNARITILGGSLKRDLTRWWLELCETRAVAFIVARGFNIATLPYNYLDAPPSSLADVKSNISLYSVSRTPLIQHLFFHSFVCVFVMSHRDLG